MLQVISCALDYALESWLSCLVNLLRIIHTHLKVGITPTEATVLLTRQTQHSEGEPCLSLAGWKEGNNRTLIRKHCLNSQSGAIWRTKDRLGPLGQSGTWLWSPPGNSLPESRQGWQAHRSSEVSGVRSAAEQPGVFAQLASGVVVRLDKNKEATEPWPPGKSGTECPHERVHNVHVCCSDEPLLLSFFSFGDSVCWSARCAPTPKGRLETGALRREGLEEWREEGGTGSLKPPLIFLINIFATV